jgi:hypothetical protein
MPMLYEELKERILQEYDVDLLCETLNINAEDLLEAFESRVLQNLDKFDELELSAYEEED